VESSSKPVPELLHLQSRQNYAEKELMVSDGSPYSSLEYGMLRMLQQDIFDGWYLVHCLVLVAKKVASSTEPRQLVFGLSNNSCLPKLSNHCEVIQACHAVQSIVVHALQHALTGCDNTSNVLKEQAWRILHRNY